MDELEADPIGEGYYGYEIESRGPITRKKVDRRKEEILVPRSEAPQPLKTRKALCTASESTYNLIKSAELRLAYSLFLIEQDMEQIKYLDHVARMDRLPRGPDRFFVPDDAESTTIPLLYHKDPGTVFDTQPPPPPFARMEKTLQYVPELWALFQLSVEEQTEKLSTIRRKKVPPPAPEGPADATKTTPQGKEAAKGLPKAAPKQAPAKEAAKEPPAKDTAPKEVPKDAPPPSAPSPEKKSPGLPPTKKEPPGPAGKKPPGGPPGKKKLPPPKKK